MDTREKIVAIEHLAAMAEGQWTAIAGFFDPMTAVQADRIARHREDGRKLLVVVLEGEEALLPAAARAALVAALRSVDAVTVARAETWESAIPQNVNAVYEDAAAERTRTADFVQFILERQRSADSPEAAREP